MSFRPTRTQALASGAYQGLLVGVALALLGLVLGLAGVAGWAGVSPPLAVLVPLLLGPLTGAGAGLLFGRGLGADIDDDGVHLAPARVGGFTPWLHVADLRVERRGWRNEVVVWLDSGGAIRLPAPYDGRLLASDHEFERKLFMLRNLWETHRSFHIR